MKNIIARDAGNVSNVRLDAEFNRFIELVGGGEKLPEHWHLLAEALGIHANTISKWKQLPEFEQARVKGINRRLQAMEDSGKEDWRQWEASLRLLGVKSDTPNQTNIQVNINPIMGGSSVDGFPTDDSLQQIEVAEKES